MKLKEGLKAQLKRRALTASQLARMSGVPKQSISDWLGGTSPRNIRHLKSVASVLGISIDELCFGQEAPSEISSFDNALEIEGDEKWVKGIFEIHFRRIK